MSVSISSARLGFSDIGRSLSDSTGYFTISASSYLVGCILFFFLEHKQHKVVIVVAETQPQATNIIIIKAHIADKHKTDAPTKNRTISHVLNYLKLIEDSSTIADIVEFYREVAVTPFTHDWIWVTFAILTILVFSKPQNPTIA